MDKKTIVVLFGGQSSEHEISCKSAVTILQAIDPAEYDIKIVGITKEGHWLLVNDIADIANESWEEGTVTAVISPDGTRKELICMEKETYIHVPIDLVFPVLHGRNGEDGTVQGLLELAGLPYVGCGLIASALGMDKLYTKQIVHSLGLAQAAYVPVRKEELSQMDRVLEKIESRLPYPIFVKPANAGSSRGISKAHDRKELEIALTEAACHDERLLAEETILGRELECAVLGSREVHASGIGEIVTAAEFYDYDSKYNDIHSRTVLEPELPAGVAEKIQQAAVAVFRALNGYGLARVDFFLEQESNRIIFNEINTLPGFTDISMYPMLWRVQGIDIRKLVAKQLELAYERRK